MYVGPAAAQLQQVPLLGLAPPRAESLPRVLSHVTCGTATRPLCGADAVLPAPRSQQRAFATASRSWTSPTARTPRVVRDAFSRAAASMGLGLAAVPHQRVPFQHPGGRRGSRVTAAAHLRPHAEQSMVTPRQQSAARRHASRSARSASAEVFLASSSWLTLACSSARCSECCGKTAGRA
jgi:hypothetical protein